jgi:hypothetical protein
VRPGKSSAHQQTFVMTLLHIHLVSTRLPQTRYHSHTSPFMNNNRATLWWHAQRGRHSTSSICQFQQLTQYCSTGATTSPCVLSTLTWLYRNTSATCKATCVSRHPGLYCQAPDKATRHEETPRQFQDHKHSVELQWTHSCTKPHPPMLQAARDENTVDTILKHHTMC